jgi:tol-pal system protein YbgF
MIRSSIRAVRAALLAAPALFLVANASAQEGSRSPGILDNMFGNNQPARSSGQAPEVSGADLVVRLDRLESQIRQLTGAVEQLQFRNQQLEQQVKKAQEDNEFRFQELGGKTGPRTGAPARPPTTAAPGAAPVQPSPPAPPAQPGRRSDVFDPSQNPGAPGAPQTLGAVPANEQPLGAPGGRAAGAPLDLSTLSSVAANNPSVNASALPGDGTLPPPPPRNTNGTGAQVASVAPPSDTPKDLFDLSLGYVKRKEYPAAEASFRQFLGKYPNDRLVADSQYWLGESLYQRQRYRDAAESFLTVTTKYDSSAKAPEALLRLGQSLAALGEKQTACAAWGEIGRKYARASASVKTSVASEQKRVGC